MDEQEYFGSKLGIDIWQNKYQHDGETFDTWLNRVSGGDADVRKLIAEKKFMFAGRILANRGVDDRNVSFSNCYVISSPEDNLESIFDSTYAFGKTFSAGGGCGTSLSNLAPRGAKINNAAKTTSGAVSFAEMYNSVTKQIGQDGRRGGSMLSLSSEHPDIIEFINAKTDDVSLTKCNLSMEASDLFMDNVVNNRMHTLTFTRSNGDKIEKEILASEIFSTLAENNWDWSEPGIMFLDRMNKHNMMEHISDYVIHTTNLCVTGDTEILTSNGYNRIDELIGQDVHIWNGYEFSQVTPMQTGEHERIYNVKLSDGNELNCTGYHKFITFEGYSRGGKEVRKECKELNIGDRLVKCKFPVIDSGTCVDTKIMYTQGFYSGDGCFHKQKQKPYIWLYDKKMLLVNDLCYSSMWTDKSTERIVLTLSELLSNNKSFVPDTTYSIQSRLDWLAGLIDSDGCKNSSSGSISISSVNRKFLHNVKLMLNTLGVNPQLNMAKSACKKLMPDGNGGNKEYACKDSYRLNITAYNVRALLDLGLNIKRVDVNPIPKRETSQFIKVTSVEETDVVADKVYCFTEYKNHSGIFNGVITANCGEQPLPDDGACLLGSINLSEFVLDNGDFKYSAFMKCVRTAVNALNDVLDEGIDKHPLDVQKLVASKWRQIGLGVMGYADCLIKMGMTYGSTQALEFTESLAKLMLNIAVEKSASIANQNGVFEGCSISDILHSEFVNDNLNDDSRQAINDHGLRNAALLSIAPTGSISTMLGISGGIEPHYALSYMRKTESLHAEEIYYDVNIDIVNEYHNRHGKGEKLPEYFITAKDIPYIERIETQAVWQQYVDAGISSTVNLPNDATVNDVKRIYISAWKHNLKGVTVHRDGNKRTGVLTESTSDVVIDEYSRGEWASHESDMIGKKVKVHTGCGKITMHVYYSPSTKRICELWIDRSGNGGCERSLTSIGVLMSGMIRLGGNLNNIKKAISGIGGCNSFSNARVRGTKVDSGKSCTDAMLKKLIGFENAIENGTIDSFMGDDKENGNLEKKEVSKKISVDPISLKTLLKSVNLCPDCGVELIPSGSCYTCQNCGYSRCD